MSTYVNHAGSGPVRVICEVGLPVVVIVKVPCVPTLKVLVSELVISGATKTGGDACTVRVKFCTASGGVPSDAVMTRR